MPTNANKETAVLSSGNFCFAHLVVVTVVEFCWIKQKRKGVVGPCVRCRKYVRISVSTTHAANETALYPLRSIFCSCHQQH